MYAIKCENGIGICRGCLSSDRSLSPLTNYDLYRTLLNMKEETVDRPDVLVCWECAAIMRRMQQFQLQALKANKTLAESLEISLTKGSLSQLSICHKQYYDYIFEESYDTLALCDNDIKEEKSEDDFNNLGHNNTKDYNSGTDDGEVFEGDNNFETKVDQSSDEEAIRNTMERISNDVTVAKEKREFDKVDIVASNRIELKSLSSNQLSKRRSARIKIINSLNPTLKTFKTVKGNNKLKTISKKKKKKVTGLVKGEPKSKKPKIDYEVSETSVSKKSGIEYLNKDNDQSKTETYKSDENKAFKEKSTNDCSERKIYITDNIVIQDVSDDLNKDRMDTESAEKSVSDSDSIDNDSDYRNIERPKQEKKTRRYKKRKYITKNNILQSVVVKYTSDELDVYFNKVEISDDMITDVLKSEPKYVTEERPQGCEYCGLCFQYNRILVHHIRMRHKQVRKAMKCTDPNSPNYYRYSMYCCSLCEKIMRKEHTEAHMKYMHRFKYICSECEEVFWDKTVGQAHCRTRHTRFVCKVCNVVKSKRRYLDVHMQTWHMPCACADCGREFPRRKELQSHREAEHPDSNPELRYCVQCDIQFRSLFAYQSHVRYTKTHKPEPPESFPCSACGKVLMTKFARECHYDRFHRDGTRYQCPHCGKFFARKNGLQTHVAATHLKVAKPKDKICSYCGRAFTTNRILIHHVRTHTGERPHQCAHCPAAFAQPFPLRKHIATVHRNMALTARRSDHSSQSSAVPDDNDANSVT